MSRFLEIWTKPYLEWTPLDGIILSLEITAVIFLAAAIKVYIIDGWYHGIKYYKKPKAHKESQP